MLLLTNDRCIEYFIKNFDKENKVLVEIFGNMIKETNYNTIYNYLFCVWNITNNKEYNYLFETRNDKYLEKIVQVIKTNKIEKITRIGLLIIRVN